MVHRRFPRSNPAASLGEWQGFSTYISRYLGSDLTVAVLANLADAKVSRIVEGIAQRVDSSLKE
jgi:hypothetical protein